MLRLRRQFVVASAFSLMAFILAVPVQATDFDDVPATYWAYPYVQHITDLHIMDGCAPNLFCPYQLVTRADMAKWLERAVHYDGIDGRDYVPPAPTPTPTFLDLPIEACRADWIDALYQDSVTKGCHQKDYLLYCPEKLVSRAEMAIFMYRVWKLNLGADPPYEEPTKCDDIFDDAPCGQNWPKAPYIEAIYHAGITQGCDQTCKGPDGQPGDKCFCPYGVVTRAQMAAFLTRVLDSRYCCNGGGQSTPCFSNACWSGNAPETGWEVPTLTMDSSDEGHELVAQ